MSATLASAKVVKLACEIAAVDKALDVGRTVDKVMDVEKALDAGRTVDKVMDAEKALDAGRTLALVRKSTGVTRRVATSFDEFAAVRRFSSQAEAQKAWAAYRQAANAEKGIVIGHGDAPINSAFNGWQALRTSNWTQAVNDAWIDGAVDAGLPVRLVTPFKQVYPGSVTWGVFL